MLAGSHPTHVSVRPYFNIILPKQQLLQRSKSPYYGGTRNQGGVVRIFFISPVRLAGSLGEKERAGIAAYVKKLELAGHRVHWPQRDTKQDDDAIGHRMCVDNRQAMLEADETHIWWNDTSLGSVFDLGMAFMGQVFTHKKLVLANPERVAPTPQKSFTNVVLALTWPPRS